MYNLAVWRWGSGRWSFLPGFMSCPFLWQLHASSAAGDIAEALLAAPQSQEGVLAVPEHPDESSKPAQDIALKSGWCRYQLVTASVQPVPSHLLFLPRLKLNSWGLASVFVRRRWYEKYHEAQWLFVKHFKAQNKILLSKTHLSNVRLSVSVKCVPPFFCYSAALQPPVH